MTRVFRGKNASSALCLCLLLALAGCGTLGAPADKGDALFQVSTLNALMLGLYDGIIPAAEFLENGDTGLGTIDKLDGEMIALDGVVYQMKADGGVLPVDSWRTIPFGVTGWLVPDAEHELARPLLDLGALMGWLDQVVAVETTGNSIFLIRLDGVFTKARVRSVPAQTAPYPRLSAVTDNQVEFLLEDVQGSIVGVYFPDFFADFNLHGWHLHFITQDRTRGGHLLDASVQSGRLQVDQKQSFFLVWPDRPDFAAARLAGDLSEEILAVER